MEYGGESLHASGENQHWMLMTFDPSGDTAFKKNNNKNNKILWRILRQGIPGHKKVDTKYWTKHKQ